MKKLTILFLLFTSLLTLSSCKKDNLDTIHEVPDEQPINLQTLQYYDYLKLSNPVITINVARIGEIKLELFPALAPITVDNFINYVIDGEYDDNEFHRVINGFVIQGGRLEEACNIFGEVSENDYDNDLNHFRGVISMARIGNDYNSGSSQFFIVNQAAYALDGLYASFGGVISGFNVLDYIAAMQYTGEDIPNAEFPYEKVEITSITVELNGYVVGDRVCYTE